MTAPSRAIVPAWDHAPAGPDAGPRHVLRREYFGALVYDRETCQYAPYDVDATRLLLARRDGPVAAGDAAEAVFLASLEAEGLIGAGGPERGRLLARVVADRAAPDRLSAPLTVTSARRRAATWPAGTARRAPAPARSTRSTRRSCAGCSASCTTWAACRSTSRAASRSCTRSSWRRSTRRSGWG